MMKVPAFFVGLIALTWAICPPLDPVTCGPTQILCPGFSDPKGCPTPDTCIPSKGKQNSTYGVSTVNNYYTILFLRTKG